MKPMEMYGKVGYPLYNLLRRLTPFKVNWKFSFVPGDDMVYEPGIDREVAELEDANVISSLLKRFTSVGQTELNHMVLLDLDIPAYLVPSSTRDHHHLYIDVPGGIPHKKYMELLKLLAECRIIEQGYADVSIARGHSDLRLPWVSKGDQDKSDNSGVEALAAADAAKRTRAELQAERANETLDLPSYFLGHEGY